VTGLTWFTAALAQYLLHNSGEDSGSRWKIGRESEWQMVKKNVLIVDDEKEICWLLNQALSEEGYRVSVAYSGKEGLIRIKKNGEVELLVLDLHLPDMNGLDLLEQVRALGLQTPTVVITAFGDEESRERAAGLGVKGFLDKPFEVSTLLATLLALSGRRRTIKLTERRKRTWQ
jgi:DNA-binding response OmpR family regulator